MKVENIKNNNGIAVKNQFIITENDKTYFQSYETIICMIEKGQIYLDKNNWNYSKTTSKYRNMFLGLTTKETENMIKTGKIMLLNLN